MLLQRQYSLWKWVNIIIGVLLLIMFIVGLFFQWKISKKENSINKNNASILNLDNELSKLKEDSNYKKYKMGEYIKKNQNNTNYYALYKYLNSIKKDIKNALTEVGINRDRFYLSVDNQEVNISTIVPNYNFLYNNTWWVFAVLEKRPFIEKINVNSYESKDNLIYFDINLQTK